MVGVLRTLLGAESGIKPMAPNRVEAAGGIFSTAHRKRQSASA